MVQRLALSPNSSNPSLAGEHESNLTAKLHIIQYVVNMLHKLPFYYEQASANDSLLLFYFSTFNCYRFLVSLRDATT